jgi:hypothetical protein
MPRATKTRNPGGHRREADLPDASASPKEVRPMAEPDETPQLRTVVGRRKYVRPAKEAPAPIVETVDMRPRRAKPPAPIQRHRKSKLDAYIEKVGILSDTEVAVLAGVTPANVTLWRRRRGIPSAREARKLAVAPPVEVPVLEVEPVVEIPAISPLTQVPAASPLIGARGYVAVTSDDRQFVVLADDFAQAAEMAVRRLARWRPEVQVVGLEYVGNHLSE